MAKFFHFGPDALYKFDYEDLYFWSDRMKEVIEAQKKANGKGK